MIVEKCRDFALSLAVTKTAGLEECHAPTFTRIVLASRWLPSWMAVVLGTVATSFAFVTRVRSRLTLLACALAVGIAAVVVSWWGLHLPLVNMAADIRAG